MNTILDTEETSNAHSESATESEVSPANSDGTEALETKPEIEHSDRSDLESKSAETSDDSSKNAAVDDAAEPDAEVEQIAKEQAVSGEELSNGSLEAKTTLKQIKALAKELRSALENGQLKECLSLYEQCQAKLKRLDDMNHVSADRKKLQRKLNKLNFEIQQLKKWRNWGMNQARQELIEQLITLQTSEEHPRDLYTKLKSIRDQWHKWNKTGDFPNQKLRTRFSDAYNKAFEPCKRFFKEQKQQREQNKKTRKKICAELEELFESTDWNHRPDWHLIGETLQKARKEWKSAVPLNKKDWEATNNRFDEVLEAYKPYIEQERDKGIRIREDLIRKANALDTVPIKTAIDKAKSLQKDWQSVTIRAQKKKENELWKEFKTACDRQFARRSELFKEKDKQRKESIEQKQKLIREIKEINQLSPDEIKSASSKASDILQRWRQTENPREKKKSSIDSEFNHEVSRYHQLIKHANKLELESIFQVLETKAAICDTLEQSQMADDSTAILTENKEKWESITENCGKFDDAIRERFEAACQNLETGLSDEILNDNFETKKKICLQLEVLTDLESPPAFAKERMQYNVERLNEAMTKRVERTNPKDEVNDLIVQYWLTGAVPGDQHESISERFHRVRLAVQETVDKKA